MKKLSNSKPAAASQPNQTSEVENEAAVIDGNKDSQETPNGNPEQLKTPKHAGKKIRESKSGVQSGVISTSSKNQAGKKRKLSSKEKVTDSR